MNNQIFVFTFIPEGGILGVGRRINMLKKYNVGILLFDYVDALDFTGPYEVFNLTTYNENDVKLQVEP